MAGRMPPTACLAGSRRCAPKSEVRSLLQDLGWKDEGIIDPGGIRTARGPENYIVLFFEIIGVPKSPILQHPHYLLKRNTPWLR